MGRETAIQTLNALQVLCAEKKTAKEQVTTTQMTAACYQMEDWSHQSQQHGSFLWNNRGQLHNWDHAFNCSTPGSSNVQQHEGHDESDGYQDAHDDHGQPLPDRP